MQTKTNTVDTESAFEPQQNQSKQTRAKSVPKSSNVIDRETLQLIQEAINAISSSMNLNENIATKPQKVHASLHNEHGIYILCQIELILYLNLKPISRTQSE